MEKEDGLIEFFENLEEKEVQQDSNFDDTFALLKESKSDIGFLDYHLLLIPKYCIAKCTHNFNKAYRWIYHHAPLGAHPCCQERIEAAQKYKALRLSVEN